MATVPLNIPAPVTTFWQQFKEFAFKGNLVDLALAVVIGGAFGKVVDSFVKAIVMPLLSYIVPEEASYKTWTLGQVEIGAFLAELINFLIVGVALFVVIKKILRAKEATPVPPPPEGPVIKACPYCLMDIPI
ncbi:MAG TPA: large conductance mechanosensitive channel protein MscL, partial [bacterium]|nr:large conductance mechanosensitive channel protein MscL [bacterium]